MKASGKSFRKGIWLAKLFDMFPDEAYAEAWSLPGLRSRRQAVRGAVREAAAVLVRLVPPELQRPRGLGHAPFAHPAA